MEGLVDICVPGGVVASSFRKISGNGFTISEARVLCREMGLGSGE